MRYDFRVKLLLALAAVGVAHALYNFLLPLHPDEAYYWLWSRYIDWSYYDHPAMIAWMLRLFAVFGDSEGAVRLCTVFCMTGAGYALCMLAYRIAGEKAGWITFISFAVLPATAMGYVFVTPDSPLILFWCAALYSGYLAVQNYGNRYYILTGVFIALMITSKYTAVLFPVSIFFYILFFDRKLFFNKYMWLACLIGACGVLPILIWNMQHDWISVRFQYQHGTSSGFKILWDEFFILLGGIQLLPTPLFAFIIYKAGFYFKGFRKDKWFQYLMVLFLVPTIFFLYKGLFKKMELNWPIIGFLSALPLMAAYVVRGYHRKLYKVGAYFAGALTVLLMASPFLPLPDAINISLRLTGTKDAVMELERIRNGAPGAYFSGHLTTASMIAFYAKGHPRVYIPVNTRFSQFNIWDKDVDFSQMSGYFLGHSDKGGELREKFPEVEFIKEYPTGSKTNPDTFYIYKMGSGN